MAIENVAGETAGQGQAADLGAGRMESDSSFALPNDFDADIDDSIELPEEPSPSESGAGAPPTRPSGAPASDVQPIPATGAQTGQRPAAAPAQSVAAPQTPQPVAQPQAVPAGQTPVADSTERRIYTPGELATQLGRNKDAMIDALAAQKFQLSPQETQALEVDAVGVLPKIMARVYFEATVNGLQQLANMVPRMVEHVANERLAENAAEGDFHTEWPNIDRNNGTHMRTVAQLAASYRQMNPNASQADAVKYVGMAATHFLGLQMPQKTAANGQRPGNGALSSPARGRNPPFAPAAGGRAQPPAGTPTGSQNPFEGLGLQFDE